MGKLKKPDLYFSLLEFLFPKQKIEVQLRMKKLLSILCFMVISSTCLATANFTSPTGVFLVPNVSVDGNTTYESVTLQLNLANNTFTILDATLKDTSFSETVIETLSLNGLKVDFFGCARSGFNQVTCKTKVVSSSLDQEIEAFGNRPFFSGIPERKSPAFDDLSKEYAATSAVFDRTDNRSVSFTAIQGVPVEVKFIYNDIDINATSFSAFKPLFYSEGTNQLVQGDFRNISF